MGIYNNNQIYVYGPSCLLTEDELTDILVFLSY